MNGVMAKSEGSVTTSFMYTDLKNVGRSQKTELINEVYIPFFAKPQSMGY